MVKYLAVIRKREEEVASLIEFLSEKSHNFDRPKLILIGGYALRAFIPFSRTTRDCDFVLQKKDGWHVDDIKDWFGRDFSIQAFERKESFAFMRCLKLIKLDSKSIKVVLDFMEGEIVGRSKFDRIRIDDSFITNSEKVGIRIDDKEVLVNIPSYLDYFIIKVISARPSDIRDIAALIWKKGLPSNIEKRIAEILPFPENFKEKLEKTILPVIKDERFLSSWRGTFLTTEFTEETKSKVRAKLEELASTLKREK